MIAVCVLINHFFLCSSALVPLSYDRIKELPQYNSKFHHNPVMNQFKEGKSAKSIKLKRSL